VLAPAAWATTYYSQGSFAANLTSSWNTVRTGGGSSPSGFTSGDTFIIQNGHNLTVSVTGGTTTNWAVSGTGNKVEIESGGKLTNSGDGSVPNITISGTFQIDGGGTYVMAYARGTTGSATEIPGVSRAFTANGNGTVEIQKWGDGITTSPNALPSGVTWGNLTINITTALGGSWQQGGNVTAINGNLTILATGSTVREFRLVSGVSSAGGPLALAVGGNIDVQGGFLKFTSGTNSPVANIAGNISVSGGTLQFTDDASGSPTVSVGGNTTVSGGTLNYATSSAPATVNVTGNVTVSGGTLNCASTATYTHTITGDLNVSSGTFSFGTSDLAAGGANINLGGNFNHSGGTISGPGINSSSGNFKFTGGSASVTSTMQTGDDFKKLNIVLDSGKKVTLSTDLQTGSSSNRTMTVNSTGDLECNEYNVVGSSSFVLSTGATLGITDTAGISGSGITGNIRCSAGTRTFSSGANYIYNGGATQVTGTGLPATVNNLANANLIGALSLSASETVNGTLVVSSGANLDFNGFTVTTATAPSLNGMLTMEVNKTGANTFTGSKLIQTAGSLSCGGALTVTATGSILANGDSAPLFSVTSGNYSGWFSGVSVPTLGSGLSWDTNDLATVGYMDIYPFTTTALALATSVNSNAVISVAKMRNHATTVRGTPYVATVTSPANGSASISGGILTYSPNPGFAGSDSFTCTFQDGHGWQTMPVSVTVGSGTGQSPNVLSSGIVGVNFVVNFAGVPGITYTVETNSAANGSGWTKLGNITATSTGAMQITDPLGNGSRFYRTVYPSY